MKAPTNRALQAKRTKNRLFNSAIKLVKERGYGNVTIEEISRGANVSVGAFYYYYKSKYEIFSDFYKQIDRHFETEVAEKLTGDDVKRNVEIFFREYALYNTSRGYDHVKLMFETQDKLFADRSRYLYVLFKELLERGKRDGRLTDAFDVDFIEDFLLVLARGVVFDWIVKDGAFDLGERMANYAACAMDRFAR